MGLTRRAILGGRDRELPRLEFDRDHRAVDVRLEDSTGRAVKRGLLSEGL